MQEHEFLDEQMLGSFVDGQLDASSCERVLAAMERDAQVRDQVYQLRRAKDLLKLGFNDARPPQRAAVTQRRWWQRYSNTVAASLAMLAVGGGAWSFGYYYSQQEFLLTDTTVAAVVPQQGERVVLHVSDSDPSQFAAALDYVESFIEQHEGQGDQIEVIANAGGLDLMRVGVSPVENRVRDILSRHKNVQFVACANALHNLQARGEKAYIIDNIDTRHSAVDRIVERLQSGWRYIKVESLTEL